jgi:hypothetical protein
MCVSLGFVVLVFLEESKEWFLGCGERTKRVSLSLSRACDVSFVLLGVAVYSCGFVVDYSGA